MRRLDYGPHWSESFKEMAFALDRNLNLIAAPISGSEEAVDRMPPHGYVTAHTHPPKTLDPARWQFFCPPV